MGHSFRCSLKTTNKCKKQSEMIIFLLLSAIIWQTPSSSNNSSDMRLKYILTCTFPPHHCLFSQCHLFRVYHCHM